MITAGSLSPGEDTGGSGGMEGVPVDDEWKRRSPVPLSPNSSWSRAHCTQGSDKHGVTADTETWTSARPPTIKNQPFKGNV